MPAHIHRSPIAFLAPALAVSLMLAACSDSGGPEVPGPRTVITGTVSEVSASGSRFAGELRASDRSELAFEIGGAIVSIPVDLGDPFARGDVLGRIDDRQPRLDLAARRADLSDAEATLADATLDYERRAGLAGTGAVSQSAIDQARARLDSAQARVEARRAEVSRAEERLADTQLIAPYDGEVVARLAEPSEVVAAGKAVLRVIGDQSAIEAVVNVSGRIRETLAEEQRATVRIRPRDIAVVGQIVEIGAEANAAGLFPITIATPNPNQALRPGESVEVRFIHDASAPRLLIPLAAYVPSESNAGTVFVIDDSGDQTVVASRRVTLGALRDDGIEIIDGLEAGTRVVLKGADLLTDGEAVQTTGEGLARYNQ